MTLKDRVLRIYNEVQKEREYNDWYQPRRKQLPMIYSNDDLLYLILTNDRMNYRMNGRLNRNIHNRLFTLAPQFHKQLKYTNGECGKLRGYDRMTKRERREAKQRLESIHDIQYVTADAIITFTVDIQSPSKLKHATYLCVGNAITADEWKCLYSRSNEIIDTIMYVYLYLTNTDCDLLDVLEPNVDEYPDFKILLNLAYIKHQHDQAPDAVKYLESQLNDRVRFMHIWMLDFIYKSNLITVSLLKQMYRLSSIYVPNPYNKFSSLERLKLSLFLSDETLNSKITYVCDIDLDSINLPIGDELDREYIRTHIYDAPHIPIDILEYDMQTMHPTIRDSSRNSYSHVHDVKRLVMMQKYRVAITMSNLVACYQHDNVAGLKWIMVNTNVGWPDETLLAVFMNREMNGKCTRFMRRVYNRLLSDGMAMGITKLAMDPKASIVTNRIALLRLFNSITDDESQDITSVGDIIIYGFSMDRNLT